MLENITLETITENVVESTDITNGQASVATAKEESYQDTLLTDDQNDDSISDSEDAVNNAATDAKKDLHKKLPLKQS
ncbi:hypothetical protein GUI12_00230 [Anaplasmataceae bacterium AB001_6]|nr:hypothetical protein GUI12_00230 [Anaplasmataceae bacterium AB001_6]